MIAINLNNNLEGQIKDIEQRLGDLKNKAPAVLRNALNNTSRAVRKQIVADAKSKYALSDKTLLRANDKTMALIRAKGNEFSAALRAKGAMTELIDFMVSPTSISSGDKRPTEYAAHVLSNTSLVGMPGSGTRPKPFVVQFKSGHKSIVERVPGKRMESDSKKEFIRKLLAPSVPQMLGNPDLREKANALIATMLPDAITKQIDNYLRKAAQKNDG